MWAGFAVADAIVKKMPTDTPQRTTSPRPIWDPAITGEILLHVGPRKTGTTAVQSSLARARDLLARQNISYPGKGVHHRGLLRALLNGADADTVIPDDWLGRTLLSDETLDMLSAQRARQLAETLGPDRLQVLITARRFAKVLPSVWQQRIKRGNTSETLAEFVQAQFTDSSPPRWQRVDRIAAMWADTVGPARVWVLLVDGATPDDTYRTVEGLLGIPNQSLLPAATNRGLTLEEAEVIRQIGVANTTDPRSRGVQRRVNRLVEGRTPRASERKIKLPQWAEPQVRDLQAAISAGIEASGCHVLGDLASWAAERPQDYTDVPQDIVDIRDGPTDLPQDAIQQLSGPSRGAASVLHSSGLAAYSTNELARELVRRLKPGA